MVAFFGARTARREPRWRGFQHPASHARCGRRRGPPGPDLTRLIFLSVPDLTRLIFLSVEDVLVQRLQAMTRVLASN